MRSLWLISLACLLVAAQAFQLPNIEEPEEDVLDELAEDEDLDLKMLLGDVLEDEEIDEDDDDDEEETGRQLAELTGSEQERLNTFMDTVLAQLKRQAQRDLEPLKFTLTKPKKNTKNGKKKQNKKKQNKKKQNKTNKSKNGKRNDNKDNIVDKKNNRNPKDIDIPEFSDTEDHQIQKRQAEAEDEVEIEKKNNKRRKNNNNKNNKNNKNKNNKRKSNNKVVLKGMSHIVREGDVKRYNMKKGTALLTEFNIGPVELDVTRKIDGEEHKAAATAETLKGQVLLKINKEGKPRVKKLKIMRPKDITTTGSLARGLGGNNGLTGIFRKSVKQVAPTATRKLLKTMKEIIQSAV